MSNQIKLKKLFGFKVAAGGTPPRLSSIVVLAALWRGRNQSRWGLCLPPNVWYVFCTAAFMADVCLIMVVYNNDRMSEVQFGRQSYE